MCATSHATCVNCHCDKYVADRPLFGSAARTPVLASAHIPQARPMNGNRDKNGSPQGEFQALLDATVDAVILIDHRGHIEAFNRAGERLFGYAAEEVIGQNVSVLMTGNDRDSHDRYMARYMKSKVPHIIGIGREVDARRKDGSIFPVFLSVGQIQEADPPRFIGLLHDITLRREAMAAIRRERDRANLYLEIAQVFLLALSADLRVQLVNRKGCETLLRRELDLLGRDWLEVAVPIAQHAIVRAAIQEVARSNDDATYFEHEVEDADGHRHLIGWRFMALRRADGRITGYFASGEDITSRRAMERSMERTQSLLNEAQELAKLGNFEMFSGSIDDGLRPFWSPQLYRILGLDERTTTAELQLDIDVILDRVHQDDRARVSALWRDVSDHATSRSDEFRIVTANGELRYVQANFTSTVAGETGMRIAGAMLDVTEARRDAEEAQVAQERMTHVSRLATMGEMAAGIAHELNQPLAAIANYASAAARLAALEPRTDTDPDGDVPLALEQIRAQALRAGEIIRRLRALVQNRETRQETSDVNELVEEVLGFARSDARLNDVQIVKELATDMPALTLDRIQIQQVLLNLLRNGIEALSAKPRDARKIFVRTAYDGARLLRVEIEDNGPGVPQELIARIFDPFCTTKETGTGLGLAISRTIVEAHHGKLSCRAAPEGGALFVLELPAPAGSD